MSVYNRYIRHMYLLLWAPVSVTIYVSICIRYLVFVLLSTIFVAGGRTLWSKTALSCFPFLGLGMVDVCMAWLSGSFHWAIVRTFIVSVKRLVYFSFSIKLLSSKEVGLTNDLEESSHCLLLDLVSAPSTNVANLALSLYAWVSRVLCKYFR